MTVNELICGIFILRINLNDNTNFFQRITRINKALIFETKEFSLTWFAIHLLNIIREARAPDSFGSIDTLAKVSHRLIIASDVVNSLFSKFPGTSSRKLLAIGIAINISQPFPMDESI